MEEESDEHLGYREHLVFVRERSSSELQVTGRKQAQVESPIYAGARSSLIAPLPH
jgi:hypothetical protein